MMAIALVNEAGLVVQVEEDANRFEVAPPLTWVNIPPGVTVEPHWTTYDAQTGAFTPVQVPVDLETFRAERLAMFHELRLRMIAGVLGTSIEDLHNAEARVLRISQAAQDALANPAAWHGKTLAKQVLPADDAGVIATAQAIIDQQRALNEQIEQINLQYDATAALVTAATTVAELEAVTWQG